MKLQIKARIRKYLANRKLAKSGYKTWAMYRRNTDPDVIRHADRVSNFYKGYKYVYQCTNAEHYAYRRLYDYGPGGARYGYDDILDWCNKKSRFKWRVDIHRVLKQTGLGLDGSEEPDWFFNDIGGSDYIYFAFQNEQDYIMFLLRWA